MEDEQEETTLERPGSDIVVSKRMDETILDLQTSFDALVFIDQMERRMRMIKALVKAKVKAVMQQAKVEYYKPVGDTMEIWLTKEKKDVFNNEKIYDFYSAPQGLRDALPKNPSWKKTALKKDMAEDFIDVVSTFDKIDVKLNRPKEAEPRLVETKFIK
jgi:hypothetical protein